MKIIIPHIKYTVEVIDKSKEKGTSHAWTERIDKDTSRIYIKLPLHKLDTPTLAHELVHVLQFMCVDRKMTFEYEFEHLAYIMNYCMNEVLGYKYE